MRETGRERAVSPVFWNKPVKPVGFYVQTTLFSQDYRIPYNSSLAEFFSILRHSFVCPVVSKVLVFLFVCFFVCFAFVFPWKVGFQGKPEQKSQVLEESLFIRLHHDFLFDCICKEVKVSGDLEMIRGHNLSLHIDHFSGYSGSECFPNHHLLRVWHWYCADSNWRGQ